jgi:TRAP-type C4-dicarboxylate transport system permease small subunit
VSAGPLPVPAAFPPARGPLGRALDRLYDASAALGAVAMVLLLVMVMMSIISRQVGFNVPGVDAYAGYMMAAAGFLAMAHTLKKGEHIRVTLLLSSLQGGAKRALEIWALFGASLLAALSAVYSCKLAWQSYTFHDISTSNDATPLWLPELSMAVGAVVLAIAFVDELVLEIRGERFVPISDEATRNE